MTRVHYFSFIADDNGQPIPGVDVSIFLAGTIIPANIYSNEFGGNVISEAPQLITNEKGYFEFWIGNQEDINGYSNNQKFKINWEKPGITSGYIDWVDIFPQVFPVDEENYTSIVKNKTISNRLAYLWETHRNHDVRTDFFPIHGLEAFNPNGDACAREGLFTVEQEQINKVISDKYAYIWDNHSKFSFVDMTIDDSGTSASSATSAASGEFSYYPDTYNTTAHGLQPVQFNDHDEYFNKLVSNEFMTNFASRDGIQSFTQPVSGMYPFHENHLTTKEYVDSLNEYSHLERIKKTTNKKTFIIKEKDWTLKQDNEYYYIIEHGFNEEFPNVIVWNNTTGHIENDYQLTSLNNQQLIIYSTDNENLSVIVDNNISELNKISKRKFNVEDFELLDDKYFITIDYDTDQPYPFVQVWDYNNKTIHTDNVIYKNPSENNKLTVRFDSPIECIININNILNISNRKTIVKDIEQNTTLHFDITSWDVDGTIYSKTINHNTGKLYPSLNTWDVDNNLIEVLSDIESIDENTIKIYTETPKNIKLIIDDGEYNNYQVEEHNWTYNTWGGFYYTLLRHNLGTLYTNISTWNTDTNTVEYISKISVLDYNTILLFSDTPINLSINTQYPEYSERISEMYWVQNDIDSYEYVINHNKNIQYPFYSVWNVTSKREEIELVKDVEYIDENNIKITVFEPVDVRINISNGFTTPIYEEVVDDQPNDTVSVISTDWTFSNNIYSTTIQHNLNTINPHLYAWDIDLNRIVDIFDVKNIDNNSLIIYSLQPNNLLVSFENNFGDMYKYTNYLMSNALDKRGDQMTGILDMTGNTISNVPLPVFPDEVVNKWYVDDKIDILNQNTGLNDNSYYTPEPSANYIDIATNLFHADLLLDAQIKNNNDSINEQIYNIVGDTSNLQEQIITIQEETGLSPAGLYVPPLSLGSYLLSTWDIDHDLNTSDVVFTIYDLNQNIISPQNIDITDDNIKLYFETPVNGKCVITKGDYIANVTNQSVWDIDHGLNNSNVIFTAYNNDNEIIVPREVELTNNNLKLYFENNVTGKCVISKIDFIENISNQSVWNIDHDLDSIDFSFTVYDENDEIIIPREVELSSSNLILHFENNVTGRCVIIKSDYVFSIVNSNYLAPAINLYNADLLLDAQIKINEDNITTLLSDVSDLRNDVDNIIDGIGFSSYTPDPSANYINTSSSLYESTLLLDNQIKINEDNITTLLNDYSIDITITTTDWISVSGGTYKAYVIHNLNERYPNVTIWNTDTDKIEKVADIESINEQYIEISSEYQLNLIVKVSK